MVWATLVAGTSATVADESEFTTASERALAQGLEWLARNQGPDGNWESSDLGLVGMGALAFAAAGHAPGRGPYGVEMQRAVEHLLENAQPSGLLNVSTAQRDMYNHGLATFVLGQVHGIGTKGDPRMTTTIDRALRLIGQTQCGDGGWDYRARQRPRGHDLSLAVMQAKALRSAMDCGFNVPEEVVERAIRSVREHYWPRSGLVDGSEQQLRDGPGQFTYSKGGGGSSIAMAAAGVVCLQEFGQYDDWRIGKNMDIIQTAVLELPEVDDHDGTMPFDAYTLYYVGQALYQVGGEAWQNCYAPLRDRLVATQRLGDLAGRQAGSWRDRGINGQGRLSGKAGDLYATSVACFVLAIPNRFLPILQEGRIVTLDEARK